MTKIVREVYAAQLRLFQILCQSYFTFQIIFTKCMWTVNSFKCLSNGNVWSPGQRAEIRERFDSESLQKIRIKFCEVSGHVGRVKTVVTNHLRKMFRSRIHKAAEFNTTARINWDKLTETDSWCFNKPFAIGTSNNLLTVISSSSISHWNAQKINFSAFVAVS